MADEQQQVTQGPTLEDRVTALEKRPVFDKPLADRVKKLEDAVVTKRVDGYKS